MWRGVTIGPPILSGASMVRAGWLAGGKLVHYPIRDLGDGTQLQNWLAEIEMPTGIDRDWTREGRLEDFQPHYADWHFDWLDVPDLFRRAELILEYPMVDQDPLPRWSFGRVTLVGDAAHPMVPRGSNGAGQAILDARAVAQCLAHDRTDVPAALAEYERQRREATAQVVLTNRVNPPDAILREVYERSGDRAFGNVDDVISSAELAAMSLRYKQVAGMLPEQC
jgi:2-polyprenyl-6-methoxyphenol hydroxylase-like FAD-dependent oxidoreductase